MKAILEFSLPGEEEELDAAIRGIQWKRCLEDIAEVVRAWNCGRPEPPFEGRQPEEPVAEMGPVLELIRDQMSKRGLSFD